MTGLVEVVVGRVGRPHGVRGEVTIEVRTDEPERRFADGARLHIEGSRRDLTVAATRWHGERLLVRFEGVGDRTAAEALRGSLLAVHVPADERPEDDEEYYDRQLVGLRVLDHAGQQVGVIGAVVHLPAQDLLAVDTGEGERLIPFVRALVPEVDLQAGYVRLAVVEGLIEGLDD
ncbi:MAG: ribosome maturation factor RimM [Propionibacteriaceae bacterium]|nr:ribosome maturation factor RimM [Propionibacteriaceae bacterium]